LTASGLERVELEDRNSRRATEAGRRETDRMSGARSDAVHPNRVARPVRGRQAARRRSRRTLAGPVVLKQRAAFVPSS
jgi:hypothetical protein